MGCVLSDADLHMQMYCTLKLEFSLESFPCFGWGGVDCFFLLLVVMGAWARGEPLYKQGLTSLNCFLKKKKINDFFSLSSSHENEVCF